MALFSASELVRVTDFYRLLSAMAVRAVTDNTPREQASGQFANVPVPASQASRFLAVDSGDER